MYGLRGAFHTSSTERGFVCEHGTLEPYLALLFWKESTQVIRT